MSGFVGGGLDAPDRPHRRRADGVPALRPGHGPGGGARQHGREHHPGHRHHQPARSTSASPVPRSACAATSAYVDAARVAGNTGADVLFRFLLPNIPRRPSSCRLSVNLGWAMLNAAGLSFLGLGVRPPTAEWGIMVARRRALHRSSGYWWTGLFPGLALRDGVQLQPAGRQPARHPGPRMRT